MKADVASIIAVSGMALGIGGLFFIALNWNELIDECFDDWSADSRTESLINELSHFGTDTTQGRNDHAGR